MKLKILMLMVVGMILVSGCITRGVVKETKELDDKIIEDQVKIKTVYFDVPFEIILNYSALESKWYMEKKGVFPLVLIDSGFKSNAQEPCTGCKYGGISYFKFHPMQIRTENLTFYNYHSNYSLGYEKKEKTIVNYKIIITDTIALEDTPQNEEDIFECEEDSDCIRVDIGCCGCTSGGSATTINKNYYAYWKLKLGKNCKGTGCLAVMSDDWTCFTGPKCINRKCELPLDYEVICRHSPYTSCKYDDSRIEEIMKSTFGQTCEELIEMCGDRTPPKENLAIGWENEN